MKKTDMREFFYKFFFAKKKTKNTTMTDTMKFFNEIDEVMKTIMTNMETHMETHSEVHPDPEEALQKKDKPKAKYQKKATQNKIHDDVTKVIKKEPAPKKNICKNILANLIFHGGIDNHQNNNQATNFDDTLMKLQNALLATGLWNAEQEFHPKAIAHILQDSRSSEDSKKTFLVRFYWGKLLVHINIEHLRLVHEDDCQKKETSISKWEPFLIQPKHRCTKTASRVRTFYQNVSDFMGGQDAKIEQLDISKIPSGCTPLGNTSGIGKKLWSKYQSFIQKALDCGGSLQSRGEEFYSTKNSIENSTEN